MNELTCSHCGDSTVMARCRGCRKRETVCTCRPAAVKPVWLRRELKAKELVAA